MQQDEQHQQRAPQLGMHGGGAVAGPSTQHMGMSMGVNGPVTIPLNGGYAGVSTQANGQMAQAGSPLLRQMTPQQQQQLLQQQHHLREQQQRQILLNQQQHQQQQQLMAQEAQRRSYPTLVHPTPGPLANANGGPSASSTPQPINPVQAGLLRPQSQQAVHPQHPSPSAMSSNNPSPNASQGYLPPRAVSAAASGHFAQPTAPYSIVSPANSSSTQQTPQRMAMAPPKLPASVTHQQMQQMQHQHQQQQMLQHQQMQQMHRIQHQQAIHQQHQHHQRLQREQALRGSFSGPGQPFVKRESVIGWSDAAADVQHPLLQPGAGVLRLLEWSATMVRGQNRANLSYWRSFTDDFFVDGGGMSYTLSSDDQDAPQKLFDIPASILPRWYQTMFTSGLTSITFSLPSCTESLVPSSPPSPGRVPPDSPWHGICVECPSASWTFHYPDGCKVICEGSVQAVLVPVADDGCLRFEYVDLVTNSFEEFLPRKSKQISGERLAELKVKLEDSGSASPKGEKAPTETTLVNGQNTSSSGTTLWINEYGLTGKAMRCLEIAESLDLMRDLFAVTSSEGVGPSTILAQAVQPKTVPVLNAEYPPQPYPPVAKSPGLSPDEDANNGGHDMSSYTSSSMTVATPVAQPTPGSAIPASLPASAPNGHGSVAHSPAIPLLVPSSPATGGRKRKQLPEPSDIDTSGALFDRQSSPTKRSAPSPSPTTRSRRTLRNTPIA